MPDFPQIATLGSFPGLKKAESEARLADACLRLAEIQHAYLDTDDWAAIVFEGWDAAGKGGTIRRMSSRLDPRSFRVWPISAPAPHEFERHYLARFWDRLPARRQIAVFDRSWYGRVLVERVEGLASRTEWQRAYDEINAFEAMLAADGMRIVKIFLHISQEEQLRRFKSRLEDPLKRWKLSYEDFRNRRNWDAYMEAAEAMFARTHTPQAPWTLIAADDKGYARVAALEAIVGRLAEGVDLKPRPLDRAIVKEARAAGLKVPRPAR